MKYIGLLLFLVSSIQFGYSQTTSYYFSDPLPNQAAKVDHVDQKWFGKYTFNGLQYQIDQEGIQIESTSISSLSKEFIRESSAYRVKQGFIFGVVQEDSIPCVFENGRYYFGVKNTVPLIHSSSEHILIKISPSLYVINYAENGSYIPAMLRFNGTQLTIEEFDYSDQSHFDIAQQRTIANPDFNLIILSPTSDEFDQLIQQGHFLTQTHYQRER